MQYWEIIGFSQTHTKHINIRCGQTFELLSIKLLVHTVIIEPHFLLSLFHINSLGVVVLKTDNKLTNCLWNIGQSVCNWTCASGREAELTFI